MTRTHWDGTPLDIDEVPMLTSGVLEVGSRDGMVTVQETQIQGLRDHIVLPVSHTGMLISSRVARQAVSFLKTGQFVR